MAERDATGSPRTESPGTQSSCTEAGSVLTGRPTRREIAGIALMCTSYVIGLPAVALLGVLSVRLGEPLLLVIGAPSFLVASHVLFAAGLYLAGGRRIAALVRRIRRSGGR